MGGWQILGAALVTPIRRFGLALRFFWPLLVWDLVVILIVAAATLLLAQDALQLSAARVIIALASNWLGLVLAAIFSLVLAIVLTIRGLVRWHRYFILGEISIREYQASGDHRGRRLRFFWSWLILGLGYFGFALIATMVAAIFQSLFDGALLNTDRSVSTNMSASPALLIVNMTWELVIIVLPIILFTLVFKRRSLVLAYAASDSSADQTIPALSKFAVDRPQWLIHFTLSLLLPVIIFGALTIAFLALAAFAIYLFNPELLLRLQEAFTSGVPLNVQNSAVAIAFLTTLVIVFFLLSLFSSLYYVLVFHAFVSIYYREHVRERLLASLSAKAETTSA